MELSTFEIEKELAGAGYTHIIGTDEVGRGPLCGPVVAAAVMLKSPLCHSGLDPESRGEQGDMQILKPQLHEQQDRQVQDDKPWSLVRDSKKLSEKQREDIFDFIHEHFHVGIGLCDHETIDRINILEASFLAMKKAIQELKRNMSKEIWDGGEPRFIILVDGNKKIPNFSHEQKAVIGGDKSVKSISAASIIAKVTRDRMMMDMHAKYPMYGFDKHKGYGTKAHMDALAKHGPCEIHRKSFAPVKKALKSA